MEALNDADTLVIVASHLEPIYRELEPPYLEVCAILSGGLVQGYQHYVENYPGLVAHPEALSEIIILLGAKAFFNNKKQIGLIHYRRIFSLDPSEINDHNYARDMRTRYVCAGIEAKFLTSYADRIVIPIPETFKVSAYEQFVISVPPLERALNVACLAFDESVKEIFGVVDSKSQLENTPNLYPWNMWIGNPEFYSEWVALLFPVLKALDNISDSLPNDGYNFRWSGFISERLFTVYINLCRSTNRWNFVERPVIFFEDATVAERDNALTERDNALTERDNVVLGLERVHKSKSWTATRFLREGYKLLRRLFGSQRK